MAKAAKHQCVQCSKDHHGFGAVCWRCERQNAKDAKAPNELVADGSLVETRRRKDRVSGILVRAVGLPAKGQGDLFQ